MDVALGNGERNVAFSSAVIWLLRVLASSFTIPPSKLLSVYDAFS